MTLPLAGMRIGLLTASASRLGGGVFEAVAQQAALIGALGGAAPVFALGDRHSSDDADRFAAAGVIHCRVAGPRQIGFAPDLPQALLDARLDCLHLHGIWMYPSRAGLLWARRTGKRYIVSPHGMLDRWITARGRWKKALARIGYERASWGAANLLHALTASEAEDLARETGRADAWVIPNPAPPAAPAAPQPRAPLAAYIGRIHPKKNLLALVEAWGRARLPEGARLDLAGWGDPADLAMLERAVAAAGPSVRFLGPVYGAAKQALLAEARFTVLPSLSEGLPMAVLESWASHTPSVMTRACHLPEGFACGAALECETSAGGIAAALERAFTLDTAAWTAMANAAHALAAGPFCAQSVGSRWAAAYRGDPMPEPAAAP